MKYEVYFEFFGRKMRTEVDAGNIEQAKRIIETRIIFHEVRRKKDDVDFIKEFLGIK